MGKRPSDGVLYGFSNKSESVSRRVGEIWDHGYVNHIKKVPRVTNGPGYLKMSFTKRMREIIFPFLEQYGKGGRSDRTEVHPPIPGGYTNSHVVSLSKINLDDFRHVQNGI